MEHTEDKKIPSEAAAKNLEHDKKLPSDTRVVIKGPTTGEFKINNETHIIVQCSDAKYVEVLKEQAKCCPFIIESSEEGELPTCEYPAPVFENLVRWSAKYGVDGKAASVLTRPCIYRDFSYVVTDAWDDDFYRHRLCSLTNQKFYLTTMSAAEKFGMVGLLDFMAICLGCRLRNNEESTIIHDIMGIDKDTSITPEDLEQVTSDYPWFKDVVNPTLSK